MSELPARIPNPYTPGFNQAPMVFAGRGEVVDAAAEALEVAALDKRTPRPLILVGPRGVGKTVTLGEISHIAAQQHSWPAVHVEAKSTGILTELVSKLRAVRSVFDGTVPQEKNGKRAITGTTLQASAFGIGAGVDISTSEKQQVNSLAEEFHTTLTVARSRNSGLLLTLDELQNASPADLHELGGALQENVPENWPLVVAVAALPSLRETRGSRLPTYLERAEWHSLDSLSDPDARDALSGPAKQSGRPLQSDATDALLSMSGGYPYAIQVAGHFAWRASSGCTTIRADHVAEAAPRIQADLEQLFISRWEDASRREREYLVALATAEIDDNEPNGGHVAKVLGVPVRSVGYLRERLIKKGTIYRSPAGGLHFITPGMGDWIRRQEELRD
ncbi:ATP-binding protein [Corynebacterium sp. AOP40-9SA-29]|uniref:ATP-binding protein n=1 Tax=Corynebacterium sp. AOP40-9SA-29 TaxID=3457677 RepID=UPI0040341754